MLRTSLLVASAILFSAAALSAQGIPVGRRDVGWPNTTGTGSSTLSARIHYPATSSGSNTPVAPRPGGWPVVVFLHGFASPGTLYGTFGDALAAEGYVVVVNNTATFDNTGQEADGRALHAAVLAANVEPSGPFTGALDTARIGLCGHSMGGGNTANVLSSNPGYRCGLAFAPTDARGSNAARVDVPFGILVGTGDVITPWQLFSRPLYDGLTSVSGLRSLTLLDGSVSHTNLVGPFLFGGGGAPFSIAIAHADAFFRRYLLGEAQGLEGVIGATARAEPRLVSLDVEVVEPDVWPDDVLRLGTRRRLSVAAEPGPCGILASPAFAQAPIQTAFGLLLLEPAGLELAWSGAAGTDRRFDVVLDVPTDPALGGVTVPVQAFGACRDAGLALGAAAGLGIR
jgi:pimeloyl-ACP methyl ester carboxylesterase